ncbi:ATP-grasp domain-containing protein [Pseudomonadota bacterium]|nr:ATP-grasp domain-containing protein [Pseudomonadota bacterium]
MQNQNKPVLIFAQSGRFLAQSATQAGYRVWVADCFGDVDTLITSERWQGLPSLDTLTIKQFQTILQSLTKGEECSLIYGSGIEQCFHLLHQLPSHIELIANSASTIKTIKTPPLFFDILSTLSLPYPDTVFDKSLTSTDYIAKSISGLGGGHICPISQLDSLHNYYFQQITDGISVSALFLADGKKAQILSFNRQYSDPIPRSPYRLGMIETFLEITSTHQKFIIKACNRITQRTGLKGLNSLDFIISPNNELFLLEINPRPSASVELTESKSTPIIQFHINACRGELISRSLKTPSCISSLRYIFAEKNVSIPRDMVWPAECSDIAKSASHIKKDAPICSCLVQATDHTAALVKHDKIQALVIKQLLALNN